MPPVSYSQMYAAPFPGVSSPGAVGPLDSPLATYLQTQVPLYSRSAQSRAQAEEMRIAREAAAAQRAEKRRRKERALARKAAADQLIMQTRDWLLSPECLVLRRKKDALQLSDPEVQSILQSAGGTLDAVRGTCRQLADQRLHVTTAAELALSVAYANRLAREQMASHREILFNLLVENKWLSPDVVPNGVYVPSAEPSVSPPSRASSLAHSFSPLDHALNQILFFNAQGQHPLPRAQVARSNYFCNPFTTLSIITFIVEVVMGQKQETNNTAQGDGEAAAAAAAAAATAAGAQPQAAVSKGSRRGSLGPDALASLSPLSPSPSQKSLSPSHSRDASSSAAADAAGGALPAHPLVSPHVDVSLPASTHPAILSLLRDFLPRFHSFYAAYLHAQKQVYSFFRSGGGDLIVRSGTGSHSSSMENVIPTATMADVERLFEGCRIGLHLLPLLSELSVTAGAFNAARGIGQPGGQGQHQAVGATGGQVQPEKRRRGMTAQRNRPVPGSSTTPAPPAPHSFPSWTALKVALVTLHTRKQATRSAHENHRARLLDFLRSRENDLLRPGTTLRPTHAAQRGQPGAQQNGSDPPPGRGFEWSEPDLDALLDTCSISGDESAAGVEKLISLLRELNRDALLVARLSEGVTEGGESLSELIEAIRRVDAQGAAVRKEMEEFFNTTTAAGRAPLRLGAGVKMGAEEVARLYHDSRASLRTLDVLRSLAKGPTRNKVFSDVDELAQAVRRENDANLAREAQERGVVAMFMAASAKQLFKHKHKHPSSSTTAAGAGEAAKQFTLADVATIYLEKGKHPFTLLLLSLSVVVSSSYPIAAAFSHFSSDHSAGAPRSTGAFLSRLHSSHLRRCRDFDRSVAWLSKTPERQEGGFRGFFYVDTPAAGAGGAGEKEGKKGKTGKSPPVSPSHSHSSSSSSAAPASVSVTPEMVLSLFERIESHYALSDVLEKWSATGRRFRSFAEMEEEVVRLKERAVARAGEWETRAAAREKVREVVAKHELMEADTLAATSAEDIDGFVSILPSTSPAAAPTSAPAVAASASASASATASLTPWLDTLHDVCFSLQAQGLRFSSWSQLVRCVQGEFDTKAKQFRRSSEGEGTVAAEPEAPLPGEHCFILSAPLSIDSTAAGSGSASSPHEAADDDEEDEDEFDDDDDEEGGEGAFDEEGGEGEGFFGGSGSNGAGGDGSAGGARMPSQRRRKGRYTLFAPTSSPSQAPLSPSSDTPAAQRQQLLLELRRMAEAQPWLEPQFAEPGSSSSSSAKSSEAAAEAGKGEEEMAAERRNQLMAALSWPACHVLLHQCPSASSSAPGLSSSTTGSSASADGDASLDGDDLADSGDFDQQDDADEPPFLSATAMVSSPALQLDEDDLDELFQAVAGVADCGRDSHSGSGGADAVERIVELVRELDMQGAHYTSAADLVEAVASLAQRREWALMQSRFGGMLADMLRVGEVGSVMDSEGSFERLVAHMPPQIQQGGVGGSSSATTAADGTTASSIVVDPLLSIPNLFARTLAYFDASIGASSPSASSSGASPTPVARVSLGSFLSTFSHLALAERRGVLGSLVRHGCPPFFDSLLHPSLLDPASSESLSAQLSPARLDQLVALAGGGSLYRTVRVLKSMEGLTEELGEGVIQGVKYSSVQDLIEGAALAVRQRRAAEKEAAAERGEVVREHNATNNAATANAAATKSTAPTNPPILPQHRSALLAALLPPQCTLFAPRRLEPLVLTPHQLDRTLLLGGGVAQTIATLAEMDRSGERFTTWERMLVSLVSRTQRKEVEAYWIASQANALTAGEDASIAARFASEKQPSRFFLPECVQNCVERLRPPQPIRGELYNKMVHTVVAAMVGESGKSHAAAGADPDVPLQSLLHSLQSRAALLEDAATLEALAADQIGWHETGPLFASEEAFLEALAAETRRSKRRVMAARLFDARQRGEGESSSGGAGGSGVGGMASMFAFAPTPSALSAGTADDVIASLPPPSCRWEGLTRPELDSLLSVCEGNVFFVLRHAAALAGSGFSFGSAAQLLEAIGLGHQRMKHEEQRLKQEPPAVDVNATSSSSSSLAKSQSGSLAAAALAAATLDAAPQFFPPGPRLPEGCRLVWVSNPTPSPGAAVLARRNSVTKDGTTSVAGGSGAAAEGAQAEKAGVDDDDHPEESQWLNALSADARGALVDQFRSLLLHSPLFRHATLPVIHTDPDVLRVIRWVRADVDTLRVLLTELQRTHRRFEAVQPFQLALRAVAQQRDAEELLPSLFYPACKMFNDALPPNAVVPVDLPSLCAILQAAGNSLTVAKRSIAALDKSGFQCASMDGLAEAVKLLREECSALNPVAAPQTQVPAELSLLSPLRNALQADPGAGLVSTSYAPSPSITSFLQQRQQSASSKRQAQRSKK